MWKGKLSRRSKNGACRRVDILPRARTEGRAARHRDGRPTVRREVLAPGGDIKPRPCLLCLLVKALIVFTSEEQEVTPSFLPRFEPGHLFFPFSVNSVLLCGGIQCCWAALNAAPPWQKSWLRKIISENPTIFPVIFWLKMLIHPYRSTTYVSASILQQDFL